MLDTVNGGWIQTVEWGLDTENPGPNRKHYVAGEIEISLVEL